jgi:hypothetical protein
VVTSYNFNRNEISKEEYDVDGNDIVYLEYNQYADEINETIVKYHNTYFQN